MRGMLLGLLVGAVGGFAVTLHGQLSPVPSSAPGVTNVRGDVAISNQPTVLARQDGNWLVTCTPPAPAANAVPLLQPGESVALVYANGKSERVVVTAVRPDGWIRVGARRINLASVTSIEP